MSESTLRALLEAYLRSKGFTTYERDGITYWGHPELGQGRAFTAAVAWQIGREDAETGRRYLGWDQAGIGVLAPL